MPLTDTRRLHILGQLLDALAVSESELDGLKPAETERLIDEAIREVGGQRSDEKQALAEGETVEIGGEAVEIAPLPIKRMSEWRRKFVKSQREILTAEDYSDDPVIAQLECEERTVEARVALLESYIGRTLPEGATDAEVQRALGVAQGLAFPFAECEREQLIQAAQVRQLRPMIELGRAFSQASQGADLTRLRSASGGPKSS